ncbi:MAG: alpha/beta hydrolase [Sterolibacterium sp.]|jgi:pimeloyl-ACP methyl ester carboxylesterase|nr:alpha/beta hydrolase [Sterolibacterium sp.]
MALLETNGVRLNCQQLGSGPLLVMCHGLVFGSIATWYFTAAAKLATRFRVVLYDQRGHGKSEMTPTGYDLDTQATDLAGIIEQHQCAAEPEGVILVGHSYGALVAMNYALRFPQRVSKLVLVDAPLPASRYVYPSMAGVDSREALERCFPAEIRQKMMQGSRSAQRLQERMDYLFLQSSLRADVAAAHDIEDALLRRLTMPVLCLYGRDSDCLAAGERLARILPDARLQVLDCGHFIPVEAPEAMTHHLDAFL